MGKTRLQRLVQRLARRLLMLEGSAGLCLSLVAACLLLLAGVWGDLLLEFPPWLRVGTVIAAVLAGAGTFGLIVRRALASGDCDALARRLDAAAGTQGQIRSGMDLAFAGKSKPVTVGRHSTPVTQGLATIAVDRAATLAENVSPSTILPASRLLKSLSAVSGVMAGVVILVMLMPALTARQLERFTHPWDDHPPWSRLQIHVEPGDCDVVYGQGVEIHAGLNELPDQPLELVLHRPDTNESEALPMFPEGTGESSAVQWRAALADITTDIRYRVQTGSARTKWFRISVITVPEIEDVSVVMTPPEYARQSATSGPIPAAGLSGLPGTHVQVSVRSNRPLSHGDLRLSQGEVESAMTMAATDSDPHVAMAEFEIHSAGSLKLAVTDISGQPSNDSVEVGIILLKDQTPFVRLLQPQASSFATPDALIPVVVAAEDDYGVAGLSLYRSLNQSRYLPMSLPVADPFRRSEHVVQHLPLASYRLQPGDEIRLFARVEDNDPAGTKGSESAIASIRIISHEQLNQMNRVRDGMQLLASRYQQARRRMESAAGEMKKLQEELARADQDSPPADELRELLQHLAKQMQDDARALQQLAEKPLPYELDQELASVLQQMAEQMQQLSRQTQELAENQSLPVAEMRRQLDELRKQLSGQREQLQQNAGQHVDLMQKLLPLKMAESQFVLLVQRQRDLAERLSSLRDKDDVQEPATKARMRELEDEQRMIREALDQLLGDITSAAESLPDDARLQQLRETALAFAEAVRTSGADQAMLDAEAGLSAWSGTDAHAGAQKAADILASFLGKCRAMGSECENCLPAFSPTLSQCMSNTLQQLLADAGMPSFGQGSGMQSGSGSGTGNGFSARRSTMQNVGLYGNSPSMNATSASAQGQSSGGQPAEGGAWGGTGDVQAINFIRAAADLQSAGGAVDALPLKYQDRIARYFRNVVDQMEQQP